MILQPCYDFTKPNESISLIKAKAAVSAQGKVHIGDAEARLDFLPDARIHIHVSLPACSPFLGFNGIERLAIDDKDVPGFALKWGSSSNGGAALKWCPNEEPMIGRGNQNTQITSLVFHLFNYREIFGTRRSKEQVGTSWYAIHHIDLKASGWNLELKSLSTTSDIFKSLGEEGGYGLTHIGCLKKEDGLSFDGKTAEEMLTTLRLFLSFSKGMWCNPCVAVGFDDKENRVWESWTSPQGGWSEPSSWFDPHHCEQLANLFPGFMAKCENENRRKALQEVIYWYFSSNCSTLGLGIGIDAGIILTQAAIERLSFEYLVMDEKSVTPEKFNNLKPASKRFGLLFSSLGIPTNIPASLPELQKLAKQKQWSDAPRAITEVRNSFVHPKGNMGSITTEALFEAWNLGQWCLELALLRICDYSGTYSNRLASRWVGQVETVPWDNNSGKIAAPAHP